MTARTGVAMGAFDAWTASAAVLDQDGRVLLVNHAWDVQFTDNSCPWDVGVGGDYFAACRASEGDPSTSATTDALRSVIDGTRPELVVEYAEDGPTGQTWFRLSARRLPTPQAPQLLVIYEDITDRRRLQEDAHARSLALDEIDAAVIATDLSGVVTLWSGGAERLYGWTAAQAVGVPLIEVSGASMQVDDLERITHGLLHDGRFEGDVTIVRRDGTPLPVHTRRVVARDAAGAATGTIGVTVDLSERMATEHRLRAITDSIGDGLCTLDSAGLITHVNPPGERLLRTTLHEALGGSFMHWVHSATRMPSSDGTDVAATVECQLVRRDGTELPIEYVATSLPSQDRGPPGWVVVFRDVSARRLREARLALQVEDAGWLQRIRQALDGDGFVLHAQPIIELATGQTVKHELLLRMQDREEPGRLLSPAAFLPTAERFGIAPAIDRWVLARACAIAAGGHAVSVNLSATSLDDDALPLLVQQMLAATSADPANLVFEVTETALVGNAATARHFADRMHELGCKLALDDFGTGYGGFTYLKHLPVDFLKIDIEFVRDAVSDPASRHVIDAVVSLAGAFGLQTVAEGIEDEATLALLARLGVDFAQGYLLGRPTPADIVFSTTHAEASP